MSKEIFLNYLLNKGLINEENVNDVLDNMKDVGNNVVEALSKTCLSEQNAYREYAEYLGIEMRYVEISEINFKLIDKFPREHIFLNTYIPLYEDDNSIYFAIADPTIIETIEELKQYVDKNYRYILVTDDNITTLVGHLRNKIKQYEVINNYADDTTDITVAEDGSDDEKSAPIITLCDSIINDAVGRKASDIHIEPFEREIIVRYRIDGKLYTINKLKPHILQPLVARFKIMSEINIAERRLPQDGKINKEINGTQYDFRVSTMPTIHGEKIVIRIFSKSFSNDSFEQLGFSDEQEKLLTNIISRPHGIVLLSGPTGAGKSTTLYSFLRYLNKGDTNIITVEDPVENEIEGVNQVQVNNKANLTFASVLRSILRQDPNIIMIGEIRDEETAQIATRAAITGHLVFSTLHTNSAAGVVSRLIDMGIAPYIVADSLLCSISQRLVRRLCPHCKEQKITSPGEMEMLGLKEPKLIYEPKGCHMCSNTGYQGRIGIFEILPIDENVRKIIMSKEYTSELLANSIKDQIITITDDAKAKVLSGHTSLEEFEALIEEVKASEKDY